MLKIRRLLTLNNLSNIHKLVQKNDLNLNFIEGLDKYSSLPLPTTMVFLPFQTVAVKPYNLCIYLLNILFCLFNRINIFSLLTDNLLWGLSGSYIFNISTSRIQPSYMTLCLATVLNNQQHLKSQDGPCVQTSNPSMCNQVVLVHSTAAAISGVITISEERCVNKFKHGRLVNQTIKSLSQSVVVNNFALAAVSMTPGVPNELMSSGNPAEYRCSAKVVNEVTNLTTPKALQAGAGFSIMSGTPGPTIAGRTQGLATFIVFDVHSPPTPLGRHENGVSSFSPYTSYTISVRTLSNCNTAPVDVPSSASTPAKSPPRPKTNNKPESASRL